MARDTTSQDMAAGVDQEAPKVPVRLEIEVRPVAPPWVPGTMNEDAAASFHEGFAGAFISPRYEQLCTASGSVQVGDESWTFEGSGTRVHRQGLREHAGSFWGHYWPSALFPSGKGFGGLTFPLRTDGHPNYNEAYLWLDRTMIPALIVDPGWLQRMAPFGEDVSFTLQTAEGDIRVQAETVAYSCMTPNSHKDFPLALQQAAVRYTWDGESTIGMLERSVPADQYDR